MVGLLVSACPAVEYGWLYTKEFERSKFLNLLGHDDYNRFMNISETLLPDFNWWLQTINQTVHKIKEECYATEIFSDASTKGWGAAYGSESARGQWTEQESKQHIDYLELLAAFFALKIFARDLHDCQILLRIDNSTAISYINRMGGIQFPHLTKVTKDIWRWCELWKIYIYVYYIKSSENIVADAESRHIHPEIEWELHDKAFTKLTQQFGHPQIDLFSSR